MTTVLSGVPRKSFSYKLTIPLHEIDAAGIMFYGHLFRHAHDAYENFMASIGFPLDRIIRDRKSLLPLVHAQADYELPLRHGESVAVHLCVEKVGRTSFTLRYRFEDAEGRLRAEARTVHAHLDAQLGSGAPLPEDIKNALADWLCGAES